MIAILTCLVSILSVEAELVTITAAGVIKGAPRDSVYYTFVYDKDLRGSAVFNNDVIYQDLIHTDTSDVDYFYTDIISGFELPDYENVQQQFFPVSDWNVGYDQIRGSMQYQSLLLAGSGSHYVQIFSNEHIDSWVVGTKIYGNERSSYDEGTYTEIVSFLQIIDPPAIPEDVPEASIFSLMLCGLFILCFCWRKPFTRFKR